MDGRLGALKTAVVIGGGFVGVACAWQLQQRGLSVTLVDAAYKNEWAGTRSSRRLLGQRWTSGD
jgi:glycine/D-amino acid oxidase-like deaminating enzyme